MSVNATSLPLKVDTFRNFVDTVAAQVSELVCQEYERDVAALVDDIDTYKTELKRCAELLGHQLKRERQLHIILDKVSDHQSNIANSAQYVVQQSPSSKQLHDMVDQVRGEIDSALQGLSEAHNVASHHAQSAKQLHEPLISAEQEFARIWQLLQVPLIEEGRPAPTINTQVLPSAAHNFSEPGTRNPPYGGFVSPRSSNPQSQQPWRSPGQPPMNGQPPMGIGRQQSQPSIGPGMMPPISIGMRPPSPLQQNGHPHPMGPAPFAGMGPPPQMNAPPSPGRPPFPGGNFQAMTGF